MFVETCISKIFFFEKYIAQDKIIVSIRNMGTIYNMGSNLTFEQELFKS